MSYSVVMTDTAKQDLRDVAIWIAEQSKDKEIAGNFVNELRATCHKPELFPNGGALPKDHILKNMGYRYIVLSGYLIFYLVEEEKKSVNIMAIFHERKDYMRVMKKFI